MKASLRFLITSALIVTALTRDAVAQNYYWKDNQGNGRWDWGGSQWWSSSANSNVGAPATDGSAIIWFENTGSQTTYINSGFTGGWFKLNSLYAAANSTGRNYVVNVEGGGTGIELYNKIETVSGGGTLSINCAVQLGAATVEINAVGGSLTLGELRMNGKTLNSYGASSLNITGVLSGTGTYNIKNQGLTVTYSGSGANTFSGATTVENSSTLILNKSAATAAIGGSLTINSGATLRTDAANQLNNQLVTVNGVFNMNGKDQTFALAGSGTVTNSAILTNNNTGTDTFSGKLTSTGALVKTNTGTLILSGSSNDYSGSTTVGAGTLAVSANSALGSTAAGTTVASGGTLDFQNVNYSTTEATSLNGGTIAVSTGTSTFAGTVTLGAASTFSVTGTQLTQSGVITDGASSFGITKSGAGALVLSADNTYDGGTTINAGTVSIGKDLALGNAPGSVASGNITFGGGTLAITTGFTLNSNRGITLNSGGGTIDVAASQTLSYGGIIAGANTFKKSGSGALTLSGANTYSGATQITGGTVTVNSGGNLGNGNSDVTISSGATLNVNASLTVDSIKETGSGNGGVIAIGSGATLTIDGANKGALFQNSISGLGGLTMAGSGTTSLSLYGTQGYTGTTSVSGGKISSGVALSSAAFSLTGGTLETTAANLISDTATITLGGGTFSIGGTETFGNNGVTLSSSTTSILSPTNGITATVTGVVSGAGNLTKSDSGTLVLSGNNTHSGTTTVSAGVLRIGHGNALGSTTGATTVSTGAALELSNSVAVGAEALTLSGDGIGNGGSLRNVNGNNSWAGGITNSSGARINSDTGTLTISGNISNAASQSLYFGGAGNVTVDGAITGNLTTVDGAVYKNGTGNLTLSGNNSGLSGLLRIKGGTLTITNGNSLGSGSVEFGSGATLVTLQVNSNATIANRFELDNNTTNAVINVASGQTATFTGVLSQTNGTVNTNKFGKDGAGTLVFNNSGGTYNGQIQIGQGDVVLGANNALGTNTSTSQRGVDLGLNVGDVAQANNVSLLASNGVTVGQSIWVEQNTSGATRTIGISGSGTATFTNEVRMNTGTTLTVQAGSSGTDRVNISGPITQNSGAASGVIKQGAGTLALSGANTYTGTTTINAGTLKLERLSGGIGAASVTGSTIAVNSGGTLLLGAANQIGDTTGITMSGGTLGMGGFNDTAGKLSVSANSIFDFGNTGAGTSTFTFSDFDTATYGGVAGLTMENVNIGSKIVFNVDYNGNSTFNSFTSKISFSNTQLMNQISFSGGTTTLTVAAIPEPRVYAAAAGLVLLIGWAEYKRRKGKRLGVSR